MFGTSHLLMHSLPLIQMNNKRTFTIIELIIVVVVIGILVAIFVPKLLGAQERTRDAVRQVSLRDIFNAVETYAIDNNWLYPVANFVTFDWNTTKYSSIQTVDKLYNIPFLEIPKVIAAEVQSSVESIKWSLESYITNIPTDPLVGLQTDVWWECNKDGKYFAYFSDATGTMYAITALMETKKWNTTNCKWVIDRNGDWEFIVIGKKLNDIFHPVTPPTRYNGFGDPVVWCTNNITSNEIADLNNLITRFSGIPQTPNNRCGLQDFSLKDWTFGIVNPPSPDAGQKVEIPVGFNKLVWLRNLDLSAGIINIAHLTYPMFFLKSIHLDGNKHLKDLILPNSFPNLEEFVLQDSLLSVVSFPEVAPALKKINIFDTNLQILNLPAELPNLEELRVNGTKLQTIFFPINMPKLVTLDLRNNKFVAPLPGSTCALLLAKWWTSSTYIDNYNKLCN